MPVEGILPVIPTPFLDGRFDADSFRRFLDHMLPFVDGYTLLGSTGEASSLTTAERQAVTEAALAMTPEDKLVVVGVSHTSAAESVSLAQHAERAGASAVLCCAPYYFLNSSAGILSYLEPLDAALGIDLVLYDNPVSTKTVIQAEWILDWAAKLERLTAVKLTDHNLAKIELCQAAGLRVLAGDDSIVFRYLTAGVDGAMVIAPAIFPEAFQETWALMREANQAGALKVFSERILPFTHVFGIGDEVATSKAILHEVGIFASADLLPPLIPVGADRRSLLRAAYDLCHSNDEHRSAESVSLEGG